MSRTVPAGIGGSEASGGPGGTDRITVMVVDDHPVILDGVRLLLRDAPDISVTGSASSGAETVPLVRRDRPDVVLLDLRLPDMLASELLPDLRQAAPGAKVVVFTAYRDHAALQATLDAGVEGCLLKDAGATDLASAVRQVAHGVGVFDPRIGDKDSPRLRSRLFETGLTRREYEVVRNAAAGLTNPEIAEQLGLTRHTTTSYMKNAMRKLDARNRIELIAKAARAGLL